MTDRITDAMVERAAEALRKSPAFPAFALDGDEVDRRYQEHDIDSRCHELARAALEAAIPDGWRLVPVEPTGKMVIAARPGYGLYADLTDGIRAAIAAAPEPFTDG